MLLTRFLSREGVAEVLDFMPIEDARETRHDLVRDVRVIRGRMTIEVECRPAFDYARREHDIEFVKGGVIFRERRHGLEPCQRGAARRRPGP